MGNLQSTPSSSTTTTVQKNYDVFLNFRGEDTRNCFTCHLYEALHKKIETFIDNGLEKGDGIWSTIKGAIEQSKISVVIFSKDYASSKWCLRELVEIIERKNLHNQIVIPVYYRVDPSNVRNQIGSFKDSFDKYGKESQEEVQKWREALTEASNLSGWDSTVTRPDTTLIDQIVEHIWTKLMSEYTPHDIEGLIGHERIEQVISLLCLHVRTNVQIIGIWGMGGIGKTYIAEAILKKNSNQFEGVCFIQNVRERLQNFGGLVSLQKEILSKVLKYDNDLKLDGVTIPSIIQERLNRTKVLIVLDDVDDYLPFEKLATGVDRLGLGSRIIITSRDKHVLQLCRVTDQNIYEVDGFNYHDALQLFCNYAFGKNYPPEDRTVLSNLLVNYSKGNPLALKVLGSSLYRKRKQEWESVVNTLRTNLNRGIFDVLKVSYDGLEDSEKNIFLDIACFFKGKYPDYVEKILGDCYYSLSVLNDKSLITFSRGGWIQMHDLLEEMGREIVDRESPKKPGKRRWLWRQEEVQNILKYDEHAPNLRWISLEGCKHLTNIPDLSKAPLLEVIDLRHCRSLLDFPPLAPHLKYLHYLDLQGCDSLRSFPSDIHFESLNSFELCGYDNLTKFPEISGDLRVLDLSGTAIDEVTPSIGSLTKLSRLNLSQCMRLKHISTNICKLNGLKVLNLRTCKNLEELPSSICNLTSLECLDLSYCSKLKILPDNLGNLKYLRYLCLSGFDLKEIPEDICHLSSLLDLELSGNDFESLPKSMKQLSNLRCLIVNNCNMLQSLTELPLSLELLSASDCTQLRSILLDASELVKVNFIFTNCPNLEETAVGNILTTIEECEIHWFSFCCPGSEVPGWFSYKSNESSIKIRMAWHDCINAPLLEFIVCAVIEFEEYRFDANYDQDGLSVECRYTFSDEYTSDTFSDDCPLIAAPRTLIDSDHVALWYCKPLYYWLLKSEFTNCSFEFRLSEDSPNCRVKSCGVRPITNVDDKVNYAEPIKIFGVANEDIGETSGKRSRTSNDPQEEEVEPHFKITVPNEVSDEDDKVIYAEPFNIFGVTIEDIGETSGKRSRTSNDHQEEEVEQHSKRLNLDLSL